MVDDLVSIGVTARRLGVTVCTLPRRERSGRLVAALRTAGGRRRYGEVADGDKPRRRVCYARVSSAPDVGAMDLGTHRCPANAMRPGLALASSIGLVAFRCVDHREPNPNLLLPVGQQTRRVAIGKATGRIPKRFRSGVRHDGLKAGGHRDPKACRHVALGFSVAAEG